MEDFLKQCLRMLWCYLQPGPRGIFAFFSWVKGLDLARWGIQWPCHGQASISTTSVTVVLICSCCSSFPFSWRSQRLRNVDAEAWSKLSVFCKAEVCFSTQSLIAQKKLGRVFAPACYLLSTWFSFEDFFFSKSVWGYFPFLRCWTLFS